MTAERSDPPSAPAASRCRVFFALWPDDATARAMSQLAASMVPPQARKMRRDTLHLTLAFVGDVPVDALSAILRVGDQTAWPALRFDIDRIAHWPHNGIVWAGCTHTPPALAELAASLHAGLKAAGFALRERDFVAHVTLARKARALAVAEPRVAPIQWRVRDGVLAASTRTASGAEYRVLRRWPCAVAGDGAYT